MLADLKRLSAAATPGPWCYAERKFSGLGVGHDQERVYAVEILGDTRCRDGSKWHEGLKRWSSRVIAIIQDWTAWTDHPANRDLIILLRNHADYLIAAAEERDAQDSEISRLREATAYAYQLAGLVDAGVVALDNLSAVSAGDPPPHEWPVAESGEVARLWRLVRIHMDREADLIARLAQGDAKIARLAVEVKVLKSQLEVEILHAK
jgi:hypothetical protein